MVATAAPTVLTTAAQLRAATVQVPAAAPVEVVLLDGAPRVLRVAGHAVVREPGKDTVLRVYVTSDDAPPAPAAG